MKYKFLGNSGLRVSELCLGAMTFGEEMGWGASKDESRAVFDAFLEAGGNFIDTANAYMMGTSEKYLGEFAKPQRDRLVLATKYTISMHPEDVNAGGANRKSLKHNVEESLKRMDTDYLDLLWVHQWDWMTPQDELLRSLDDLISSGKVLYIGYSDVPAWVLSRANAIAELKGWTQFVGLQIAYSLIERTPERELLPMANALDIAVTPWGVLGSGILSGKYSGKDALKEHSRGVFGEMYLTERNLKIGDEVVKIAGEIGHTPSQVALNWVRQQKDIVMVPILGARKLTQLQDNIGALDFELSDKHMSQLDEVSKIELGFPHDFTNMDLLKTMVHGQKFNQLDFHRTPWIRNFNWEASSEMPFPMD